MVFGSILPWSKAHHERNWFVYRLRGDRLRIEGDLLRSQQLYESALHEANWLKSKEKEEASKKDILSISQLRQKRMQAAVQTSPRSADSDEEEDTLNVQTNPREITFEWDSFQIVRSRLSRRSSRKTKHSIFSLLLTRENFKAGKDPVRNNELGDCNMMIGHFADAELIFKRAQEESEVQGEGDSLILATLDRIAFSQWAQQQFQQALDTSSKALSVSQKYAPEKYTQILKLHRVEILLQCGQYEEGEKLCLQVLEKPQDLSAENSWYPYMLLGQCQSAERKFDAAVKSLNTALKIVDKHAPPYDMKVHRVCLALGEAYALSNQEAQAKKIYERAFDVYVQNGGTRTKNLDSLVGRQGHQYSSLNKYEIAGFCYKWSAQLREKEYGKNNYKGGLMLRNYAMALDRIGQNELASEYRARGKSMQEGQPDDSSKE